jgi:hypothetical protein
MKKRDTAAVRLVMEFLRRCAGLGATDDEIAEGTGLNKITSAAARLDLYRAGHVLNSGWTRPTRLNLETTVWRMASCAPTGAGLRVIRHSAGPAVLTRAGALLQVCTCCGRSLASSTEFQPGPVFETNGMLSAEHLPGAREVACSPRRKRV